MIRCHDLLMMSMNLSDNGNGCIISGIRKNEFINLMQNVDLTEKSRTL